MNHHTFTELFKAYQPPLYRYLYRTCGSKEAAEELLQETFYRAMLSLRLEDTRLIRAWLYKVARNLMIDWMRRRGKEAEMLRQVELQSTGMSSYPMPEEAYRQELSRSSIAAIMGQLPEHYRTILYLREIEGFSYLELAELLDISLSQVKVNLHRSKTKFKQIAETMEGGERNE
ncbi:RNA polymerase sigma factor [Paenibacillus mendelii]|uniref:RNA polymerase sigma factor n=1 Tax=Paenibacillus mendelii TaxID=206163 RepID=A0ABV6J421_9BACL|nr:sigma-70 family RNA polymerase sigma factor [Paenibacillus mendelii]MCQ6561970.1 sigma-70 family RNA polymerase sigma factor [Paenibacillus mendelii]